MRCDHHRNPFGRQIYGITKLPIGNVLLCPQKIIRMLLQDQQGEGDLDRRGKWPPPSLPYAVCVAECQSRWLLQHRAFLDGGDFFLCLTALRLPNIGVYEWRMNVCGCLTFCHHKLPYIAGRGANRTSIQRKN